MKNALLRLMQCEETLPRLRSYEASPAGHFQLQRMERIALDCSNKAQPLGINGINVAHIKALCYSMTIFYSSANMELWDTDTDNDTKGVSRVLADMD